MLRIPLGKQEYIEYFEDKAKASLRAKFESDTEIGQKGAFCKGLSNNLMRSCNIRKDHDQKNPWARYST